MPHDRHYRSIIHGMSEPTGAKSQPKPITPLHTGLSTSTSTSSKAAATTGADDRMPCDRCGADMYRMHAVWRCPACGFKSDCCGW
jgi:ribosomal protein L37E